MIWMQCLVSALIVAGMTIDHLCIGSVSDHDECDKISDGDHELSLLFVLLSWIQFTSLSWSDLHEMLNYDHHLTMTLLQSDHQAISQGEARRNL
jgi:hypothetical protein